MINLTATEGAAPGYLTLEDCGRAPGREPRRRSRTPPAQSVAAMAIVPISPTGKFCVYRSSAVHSIVDVAAYLGYGGRAAVVSTVDADASHRHPRRRRLRAGSGMPAGMLPAFTKQRRADRRQRRPRRQPDRGRLAVSPGWLQVGRCSDVGPEGKFSNLNVGDAGARANMALVPAGDSGTCAFALSPANVIVDELGRLSATRRVRAGDLAPARRVLDTRECTDQWCEGRPGAGAVVHVDLGTDAPAAAIAVTVTDTGPPASSPSAVAPTSSARRKCRPRT